LRRRKDSARRGGGQVDYPSQPPYGDFAKGKW
jgi:hypothetical protein